MNLIQADFVKNLDKQFQASRKEQSLVGGSSSTLAAKDGQSRAVTGTRASSPDSALAAVGRSLPYDANHQPSLSLGCAWRRPRKPDKSCVPCCVSSQHEERQHHREAATVHNLMLLQTLAVLELAFCHSLFSAQASCLLQSLQHVQQVIAPMSHQALHMSSSGAQQETQPRPPAAAVL